MSRDDVMPGRLLEQARGGDEAARGELLELYRNYLRLVARSLIGGALRVKLEPSDLVQETFLKAHRDFGQFAGRGEPELVAWLRQILVRQPGQPGQAPPPPGARPPAPGVAGARCSSARARRSSRPWRRSLGSPSEQASAGASRRCSWPTPWISCPTDYREVFILPYPGARPVRGDRRARWAARPAPCGCSGPAR